MCEPAVHCTLHVRGTVARAHPRPGMNLGDPLAREGGLACRHARSPAGQQCEPTTASQPPEHTASPSMRADDCKLTTASR
eukprot:5564545-Prymnesium_polylepis.1